MPSPKVIISEFEDLFLETRCILMYNHLKLNLDHNSGCGEEIYQTLSAFKKLKSTSKQLEQYYFSKYTTAFVKRIEINLHKYIMNEMNLEVLANMRHKFERLEILLNNLNKYKATIEISCKNPRKDKIYKAAQHAYYLLCKEIFPCFSTLDHEFYTNHSNDEFLNTALIEADRAVKNHTIRENFNSIMHDAKAYISYR